MIKINQKVPEIADYYCWINYWIITVYMKILKKLFVSEEPDKQIYEILERGKSLLEKNFFDWAAVEFNKAMELNPELATETVTKLFQEIQGGGNPDAIISLGINILKADQRTLNLLI